MKKNVLILGFFLIFQVFGSECLKERQERAHEVVAELLPKAKLIDSNLDVKVVACNIHIVGTIHVAKGSKKKLEMKRKALEGECQKLFNAGLLRFADVEEVNQEKEINGACVSIVNFKSK